MSDMTRNKDAQLIEGIRRRLDEGVDNYDDPTRARLAQARQLAMAAAARPRGPWWRGTWPSHRPTGDWLLPAGAFASVVATAVALALMVAEPDNDLAREVDDLELLGAGEELELFENLEFYQWLPDREQTG